MAAGVMSVLPLVSLYSVNSNGHSFTEMVF